MGSSHGPECELAQKAGFAFKAVPSLPLTKSISLKSLKALGRLGAGVFRARRILKDFQAEVVIGTGGYTTAAVLLAARSLGCRVIIHEQNAVPGRTNLWLAIIADKICVTVESSAAFFNKDKVAVTGMPVRAEFASLKTKAEARRELGLDESRFTVMVVGGSQGAKRLNELVLGMWPMIDDRNTQLLHQTGPKNLDEVQAQLSGSECYRAVAYLDMPLAAAAADIAICRSGASTLAETTAAGLPSILVPYPFAYADHQKRNAEYLVSQKAAIMCEENVATPAILADLVCSLRDNPESYQAMAAVSKSMARIDAARLVAEVALNKDYRL